MFKLILVTTVALYAGFIIWGKPLPGPAPAPDTTVILSDADANFDEPVILSRAGRDATVAGAAITQTIVPGAAAIAGATPATGNSPPRRLGDPLTVSLVRPRASGADETLAPDGAAADIDGLLRVSGSTVNMRSGPSTAAGVVGSLPEGALAEPVGPEADGWIEIRDVTSGLTGFMAARFLEPA